MDHWDAIRTAQAVGRLGTVSAAAQHLGVHRATIARHIDLLESSLGTVLFQRHGRGYVPTDAGRDLLRVADATATQFSELADRLRGRRSEVAGELVVTSSALLGPIVLRGLQRFQAAHPDTQIRYEVSDRLFRLEYGEAHVAVRAGARPEEPDNVVQGVSPLEAALYVHPSHMHVGEDPAGYIVDTRAGTDRWLNELVPDAKVLLRADHESVAFAAIDAGIGAGFCPTALAPSTWTRLAPPRRSWAVELWLVTHVDLHRSAKVQAAVSHLKAALS